MRERKEYLFNKKVREMRENCVRALEANDSREIRSTFFMAICRNCEKWHINVLDEWKIVFV